MTLHPALPRRGWAIRHGRRRRLLFAATFVAAAVVPLAVTLAPSPADPAIAAARAAVARHAARPGCPTLDDRDPWGTPYASVCVLGGTPTLLVWSAGADRHFETSDDIRSWP